MKATEISTCDESPNVEDGNEDTSNEIEAWNLIVLYFYKVQDRVSIKN
jgi:hypothetical protein